MKAATRLGRIASQLTPQAAVLAWFTPLLVAKTPHEWTCLRYEAQCREPPDVLFERVRDAARKDVQGREAALRAGQRAVAEAFFLQQLAHNVNGYAVERWEAWKLRTALVAVDAPYMLELMVWAADLPAGEERDRALERVKKYAGTCLLLLQVSADAFNGTLKAVEQIEKRYFAGHRVLFSGAVERLRAGADTLPTLARSLSWFYEGELDHWHEGEAAYAEEYARLWVDLARAEAYDMMGNEAARQTILQPYMSQFSENVTQSVQ